MKNIDRSPKDRAGPRISAGPGPDRRQRRRIETRERIFRAALQLFAERGYLETTVEDITEAADVGKGTFFNYFPTKEHVLEQYGEERVEAVERALKAARNGKRSVSAVLRDLATDLAGQSSERPELLRSVFAANLTSAAVLAELRKRIKRARNLLTQIIVLGQQNGEIRREVSAGEMARLVRLIFMGVTVAWSIDPDVPLRRTAEQVWELISPSFVVRGCTAGESQT
jgi:AcrR family transcriptional regulator